MAIDAGVGDHQVGDSHPYDLLAVPDFLLAERLSGILLEVIPSGVLKGVEGAVSAVWERKRAIQRNRCRFLLQQLAHVVNEGRGKRNAVGHCVMVDRRLERLAVRKRFFDDAVGIVGPNRLELFDRLFTRAYRVLPRAGFDPARDENERGNRNTTTTGTGNTNGQNRLLNEKGILLSQAELRGGHCASGESLVRILPSLTCENFR